MIVEKSPKPEPRYWVALCMASACGANIGDLPADTLHIGVVTGIGLLTAMFVALVAIAALGRERVTALYWVAILIVRAAATIIADALIKNAGLSYPIAIFALALTLIVGLVIARNDAAAQDGPQSPSPNLAFWVCMLLAGTVGTLAADGLGHAFASLKIGVPIAAVAETVALIAAFGVRSLLRWRLWTYWATVVVIRAWGTSWGDISKYILSLPISLALTTLLLALAVMSTPRLWAKSPATA